MTDPQPHRGFAVLSMNLTDEAEHSRIVELAVCHTDELGQVTGVWETLVNPLTDAGNYAEHRIVNADVSSAPTFAQIAPQLIEFLSGRAIVVHDREHAEHFLRQAFERIDYAMPDTILTLLCTGELAPEFLRGLDDASVAGCCDALQIPTRELHHAQSAARATAELLRHFIARTPDAIIWRHTTGTAEHMQWAPASYEPSDWHTRADAARGDGRRKR